MYLEYFMVNGLIASNFSWLLKPTKGPSCSFETVTSVLT